MCNIFENRRKASSKKCNRNGSQINELVEHQFTKNNKIFHKEKKMVHAVIKIIWAQKWKELSVAKIKGKACFRWSAFMINYISAYKLKLTFMGLDL